MKSAAHHQGLSEQQVLENRTKYGVNILTPPVKEPLWKQFLEKFSDCTLLCHSHSREAGADSRYPPGI